MTAFSFEYHLIIAVLTLLAFSKHVVLLKTSAIIGCLLSFYLPDIDHANSKPGRKLLPISWLARLFTTHRGVTHSLFALFVISSIAYLFNNDFGYGVFIGYGSHILADSFTRQGVPLLWPMPMKFRVPFIYPVTRLNILFIIFILMYLII